MRALKRMAQKPSGEATPPNNTATAPVKINPINFDELGLAKLLEQRLAGEQIEKPNQEPQPEIPEPEVPEVVQDTEEKPDVAEGDPEAEAPSQSEENAEEENDSEADHRGVQRRIDKLTARAKEAEEQREEFKRELEELKSKFQEQDKAPAAVQTLTPHDNVWDINTLTHQQLQAEGLVEWCEDHPNGFVHDGVDYSEQDILKIKRNASKDATRHIPARIKYLEQFNREKQEAEVMFPFWKDRKSADYMEAEQALRVIPQIKLHPSYHKFIGWALVGKKAMDAQAATAKKPVVPVIKAAPKQPSRPTTAPKRGDQSTESREAAKRKFFQTTGEAELASLIATRYGQ